MSGRCRGFGICYGLFPDNPAAGSTRSEPSLFSSPHCHTQSALRLLRDPEWTALGIFFGLLVVIECRANHHSPAIGFFMASWPHSMTWSAREEKRLYPQPIPEVWSVYPQGNRPERDVIVEFHNAFEEYHKLDFTQLLLEDRYQRKWLEFYEYRAEALESKLRSRLAPARQLPVHDKKTLSMVRSYRTILWLAACASMRIYVLARLLPNWCDMLPLIRQDSPGSSTGFAKTHSTDLRSEDDIAESNTTALLRNAQNILKIQRDTIKTLKCTNQQLVRRISLGHRPSAEFIAQHLDSSRRKNGKIAFSRLGKALGVSNHTAKKWFFELGLHKAEKS